MDELVQRLSKEAQDWHELYMLEKSYSEQLTRENRELKSCFHNDVLRTEPYPVEIARLRALISTVDGMLFDISETSPGVKRVRAYIQRTVSADEGRK